MRKSQFKCNAYFFITALFLFTTTYSIAQSTTPMPQPIPPSPSAASLGKYGEIPVGKYTGIPDISIPLWQVDEGDIHLPISLSYHASGVRVEENASWVGLGWSLNAGGVITRTIKGKPDENGYYNAPIANLLIHPQSGSAYCDQWSAALYAYLVGQQAYGYDSEPDMYYYNFNGISGKFVFDQNGVPYTIPYQKIKIERPSLSSWVITTPDGFIYKFGGTGATETDDIYNVAYSIYGRPSSKEMTLANQGVPSSWYLYEIDSPTGHKVTFEYNSENYEVFSGISQQVYYNTTNTQTTFLNPTNSGTCTRFYGERLSAIRFSNGNVTFQAPNQRLDMSLNFVSPTNCYALGKIVINDINNNPIKKFALNTDYFQSLDANQDYTTQRLRLNSVTELSGDESASHPPYVFTYDNSYALPAKTSASQDHWGFYNGQNNVDIQGNPVLIPSIVNNYTVSVGIQQAGGAPSGYNINPGPLRCPDVNAPGCTITSPNVSTFQFNGANRSIDFDFAKAGILTKIQYPTGGTSSFQYESNDYDLKNYVYQMGTGGVSAFATCCDPLNNPVTFSGNQYYVDKKFVPNATIPSNLYYKNQTVPFTIEFSANLDGYDDKCCKGCSTPYGYLKDSTTNTILVEQEGLYSTTTIAPPTLAPSVQSQISAGTASYSLIPNAVTITGLMLDPTHTYELYSRAATCPGGSCQEFSDCPNVTHNMELFASSTFDYNTNTVASYNGDIGGIRVHQITNTVSANDPSPVIKQYLYRVSNSPGNQTSSGQILDLPDYFDIFQITKTFVEPQSSSVFGTTTGGPQVLPVITVSNTANQYVLTSGSKFELGQTSGSFVGYSEVQELFCPDNTCATLPIGKNIYKYTTSSDYDDVNAGIFGDVTVKGTYDINSACPAIGLNAFTMETTNPISADNENIYPYPTKVNYDWKRGLLVSEATYDVNGVQKKLIVNTFNSVNESNNLAVIPAVKIIADPYNNTIDPNIYGYHYFFGGYNILAAWNYQNQQTITETDNNNNQIITTTNYFYDNPLHAQITRTEMINSKGETIQIKNKYPGDEATIANSTPTELSAIGELETQFRYATLLEKEENRNGNLMSRTRTGYQDWGNGLVAPASTQLQIGTNPMETRVNYQQYDNTNGNLLEFDKTSGPSTALQWGYNNEYPVAEAKNASNNDIFYDSFEEGDGNSSFAKTGHYGYSGSVTAYNKTINNLDVGNYVLSYWSLAGTPATWSLITTSVTIPSNGSSYTITINGQIDDVRFYPQVALMTTYTYDPLIGMTSITEPNGKITYYEYDNLLRLLNIKDQYGNIVKSFTYNYANQSTNSSIPPPATTYTNAPDTATFTDACSAGYFGSNVTYIVPAGKYSSTISQIYVDSLARADVQSNGQSYANANGTCTIQSNVYVQMTLATSIDSTDANGNVQMYNSYTFKTYSDSSYTTPYTTPVLLPINYQINSSTTYTSQGSTGAPIASSTAKSININAGANHATTGLIFISGCTGTSEKGSCQSSTVTLETGGGYLIKGQVPQQ